MKLWLITTEEFSWDDYKGFVIRAKTQEEARSIAVKECGSYSNADSFADPKLSECVEITREGEPGVILDSFNAG